MPTLVHRTLYRELLRSGRRVREAMRPGHVVLVAECVNQFAEHTGTHRAIKSHGPLPLCSLVQHAFRQPVAQDEQSTCLDHAFTALRSMNHVEGTVEELR